MNLEPHLITHAKRNWMPLALSTAFGLVVGLLVIGQAWLVSRAIDAVFLKGRSLAEVEPLLWSAGLIVIARGAFGYAQEISAHYSATRITSRLRKALLEHLFHLGPAYSAGERTGELSSVLMEGVEALNGYYSLFLPQLCLAAVIPLLIVAVVFPMDLLSALIFVLTIPLIPLFMFLIGSATETLTRRQWQSLGRLSAQLLDAFQGLTALKLLGRSEEHVQVVARAGESYRQATMEVLRVTFLSALALELLATLSTAVVAVQIGLRLLTGGIDYQRALFILILAPDVYLQMRQLGLRYHAGAAGVSAARRIFAILTTSTDPAQPSAGAQISQDEPAGFHGFDLISFRDIGYTYPLAGEPALRDITCEFRRGERLAVVGATGAGKSTLASLLLRFFEPTQGSIFVDGRDLAAVPVDAWRRQVAWVPQRPHLFYGSLAENLLLVNPRAGSSDMEEALDKASLLAWVRSLPAGLDTPVGESGLRLSAGQAQRLALARAFLKPAPLLILDEPTAHLDPQLEAALEQAIRALSAERTVVTIAHRLATVYQADRVLLLDRGRLAASGSHDQLLDDCPLYRTLVCSYAGVSVTSLNEEKR